MYIKNQKIIDTSTTMKSRRVVDILHYLEYNINIATDTSIMNDIKFDKYLTKYEQIAIQYVKKGLLTNDYAIHTALSGMGYGASGK